MGGMARPWHQAVRALAAPRLAVRALPLVGTVVALKLGFEALEIHPLDLNPLLSGLVAANVFLLGFLLAGTLSDYKESERLPGELAASLDTIADECLIIHAEHGHPVAAACLEDLERVAVTIRRWLLHEVEVDEVFAALRALNPRYMVIAPLIQAGFTTRLKTEQGAIRKTVIRMDAIRTTSFVAAGYVIAKLTGTLLVIGLLLTDLAPSAAESVFFVGVITMLISYVYGLIRDLDDPFRYAQGEEGAADVSLAPLEAVAARLAAERAALAAPAPVVTQAAPVAPVAEPA